ncbi:Pkinase-domain-containing protein [Schizophyllum fasciatum]
MSAFPALKKSDPKMIGLWKIGRTIGSGSSRCLSHHRAGRVRIARHSKTGQYAAIKIISKTIDPTNNIADTADRHKLSIEREVVVMKLTDHPNVLRLYDVWETSTDLYLILEYVQGGELFDHICNHGRLSADEGARYFQQIISAVEYFHRFDIAHRDLKPENILLDQAGNIKIADFGMATLQASGSLLTSACGSPHYAAPELLVDSATYDGSAADVWSCGVILYAMIVGTLPFDDPELETLFDLISAVNYVLPSDIDALAQDLISKMLVKDVRKRITIPDIKRHPFFASLPFSEGPEPTFGTSALEPILGVDIKEPELFANLRTLWHGIADSDILANLECAKKTQQKTIFRLLLAHRQKVLDQYVQEEQEAAARRQQVQRRKQRRRENVDKAASRAASALAPRTNAPTRARATRRPVLSTGESVTPHKKGAPRIVCSSPSSPDNVSQVWDMLDDLPPTETLASSVADEDYGDVFHAISDLEPVHTGGTAPLTISRKRHPEVDAFWGMDKENDSNQTAITPKVGKSRRVFGDLKVQTNLGKDRASKSKKHHDDDITTPTSFFLEPPSPSSPLGTSPKHSWLPSLFRIRTPPQTLLSTHGAGTARSEARRLLMRMGSHVALEDVTGPGLLRCRFDETRDPSGVMGALKAVRFRVEVRLLGEEDQDFRVALLVVHEKGSAESFKAMWRRLRQEWTLDVVGAGTPLEVAPIPPPKDRRELGMAL